MKRGRSSRPTEYIVPWLVPLQVLTSNRVRDTYRLVHPTSIHEAIPITVARVHPIN
jgi:hypothetical protein